MLRVFRFIIECWQWGRSRQKFKPGIIEAIWLRAYFSKGYERNFINAVTVLLRDVAKTTLPNRPVKTWQRLWRFSGFDVKYFLGVDLVDAPTRSMLCILKHFGDLNEYELAQYWDWAVLRDSVVAGKCKYPSRHTLYVELMQETIKLTQVWVDKRRTQCKQHNTIPLPTGCQQV